MTPKAWSDAAAAADARAQFRWVRKPGTRDGLEVEPRGREDQVPAWTEEDEENLAERVHRMSKDCWCDPAVEVVRGRRRARP